MFPARCRGKNAEMFPANSAKMFPASSARMFLGSSARTCPANSATMFPASSAAMSPTRSAQTCPARSAVMFPVSSADRCLDSSALPPSLPTAVKQKTELPAISLVRELATPAVPQPFEELVTPAFLEAAQKKLISASTLHFTTKLYYLLFILTTGICNQYLSSHVCGIKMKFVALSEMNFG